MSSCLNYATAEVCYNDGTDNQTLIAHYSYGTDADGDSVLVATRFTDAAGVVVDTSTGTVTAGACIVEAMIPATVTQKTLCDVQDDDSIVEFCRTTVITFNDDGSVASRNVTDYDLGGVTEYTVTGSVEDCKDQGCEPSVAAGVLTSWG